MALRHKGKGLVPVVCSYPAVDGCPVMGAGVALVALRGCHMGSGKKYQQPCAPTPGGL